MDDLTRSLSTKINLQDPSQGVNRSFSVKREPIASRNVTSQPTSALSSPIESVESRATGDKENPAASPQEKVETPSHERIDYQDGSYFEGETTEHGVPIHGTITCPDGYVFSGDFDRSGKPSQGKLRMNHPKDGETEFEGAFQGGLPHRGVLKFEDGRKVEAECNLEGRLVKGKEILPNGDIFVGTFKDNRRKEGKVCYSGGCVYEGTFKADGKTRDKGKAKYANGMTFDGEWYDNRRGKGLFTWPCEGVTATLQGQFSAKGYIKEGTTGIQTNKQGRFEGTFYNDGKYLKGRFKAASGLVFEGTFDRNGCYQKGDIWYPSGSHFHGTFHENLKVEGEYFLPSRDRFVGTFRDGIVSKGRYYFFEPKYGYYVGNFGPDGKFADGKLTLPSGTVYDVMGDKREYNHKETKANMKILKGGGRIGSGGGHGGTADRVRGEINHMVDTSMFWQRYNNC